MTTSPRARPTFPAPGTIAISGAKGGVGKSSLALNLAVALGRWGRRVLLVDGDLGLANLDVLMGLAGATPSRTAESVARGSVALGDVLLEGPAGIRVLPASSGVPAMGGLDAGLRQRLLQALAENTLDVEDVLVDTGAGLGDATLELQLATSRVLLLTTPDPTSLVDAYATLKVLWNADPQRPVDLVVNSAATEEEGRQVRERMCRTARRFLGREPGWLGTVLHDSRVAESVRRQTPVMELFPDTPIARSYERIAFRLASLPRASVAPSFWERLIPPAREELPH